MRGEEQTDNFLVDLLIFITLLIQLDGGIHGPIEEEETVSEDDGDNGCQCAENTADATVSVDDALKTNELTAESDVTVPEVATAPVAEVTTATATTTADAVESESVPAKDIPKNELKAAPVADKHDECCIIS